MPDILDLILEDHATFRSHFVELFGERGADRRRLRELWTPLAELLDRHAGAEEAAFYPALLAHDRDSKAETKDAIRDHNKIRDAVRASEETAPGSDEWWSTVQDARKENDEHMSEEEEGPLTDFRAHSDAATRNEIGLAFLEYKRRHSGHDVDSTDKDPGQYVADHTTK